MWELRCDLSKYGEKYFSWIPLLSGNGPWPQRREYHGAVVVNETTMYMWGGHPCQPDTEFQYKELWKYELQSNTWTIVHEKLTLDSSLSNNTTLDLPSVKSNPVFYPKTQSIVALDKYNAILLDPVTGIVSNLTQKTTFNQQGD